MGTRPPRHDDALELGRQDGRSGRDRSVRACRHDRHPVWTYVVSALLGALGGTASGYALAFRSERRSCKGAKKLVADELFLNSLSLRITIEKSPRILDRHREFPRRDWDALRATLVGCLDDATRGKLVVFYGTLEAFRILQAPGSKMPPDVTRATAIGVLSDLEAAYKALTGEDLPMPSLDATEE
jgi:hypothetical protein